MRDGPWLRGLRDGVPIALGYLLFATGLEATHLLSGARLGPLVDNWVADLGGLAAAFAPIMVERFRRRFPRAGAAS